MPAGVCVHGIEVEDTDNLCELLPGGAHREYVGGT